jgi:hypothetical protein
MTRTGTVFSVALLLLRGGNLSAEDVWHYVVPAPGEPLANPPPRALALSDQRPVGLKESVRYRGVRQRFGRLVYGSGRTTGVIVVVDEVAPNQIDLYVDADRDGDITDKERAAGEGLTWRTPLKAVVTEGDVLKEFPRTVLFRYSRISRMLSVATCGYLEGRALLNGKQVVVRRVDGDANGLFADAQDRIWLGDEEFLFAPILRLGEQRLAVRGDALGERLSFAPLEGAGTIRLARTRTLQSVAVEEIQVTLQSLDGVVASLRGVGAEVTVPVGDYRVSTLLLTLKDPQGGQPWGYVFGDNGGKGHRWKRLDKDGSLTVDPIGGLDFSANVNEGQAECRAGASVFVRPALYTGDGLLIERAYRGRFESTAYGGCSGRIALLGPGKQALDSATTGFA